LSVKRAFTELSDWFHALLGLAAGALLRLPHGWVFSLLLTLYFVVYQALERQASYEDLVEYLTGYAIGLSVSLAH